MALSPFQEFLKALNGETALIVYPFVDSAEFRDWYNPQPASVISDNLRAFELLGMRTLLLDIERFRRARDSADLGHPIFVADLDGGVGPIAMKALVPGVAAWLGLPVVPTRVDVWLTGERKDIANTLARHLGARLPATFDGRLFRDELEPDVIQKPRDLGGSYDVRRLPREQSIQNVIASQDTSPVLAQSFIPGFDVTYPVIFSPTSQRLEPICGIVNRPASDRDPHWINDLPSKTGFYRAGNPEPVVRDICGVTESVAQFLRALADAMDIKTYCRIDFRVPFEAGSPASLELDEMYFLEINTSPSVGNGTSMITAVASTQHDSPLATAKQDFEELFGWETAIHHTAFLKSLAAFRIIRGLDP